MFLQECKDFSARNKQTKQRRKASENRKRIKATWVVKNFMVGKVGSNCVFLPHLLANVKEKLYLCMQI